MNLIQKKNWKYLGVDWSYKIYEFPDHQKKYAVALFREEVEQSIKSYKNLAMAKKRAEKFVIKLD